uniref:Uncharacterized protein n=1 Tax=Solibacter usitatus (strain Ellin6076) TaxID=234267 RepID=Q01SU3_SOLUE
MKIFTTFCCAALALGSALYAQSNADHMTVHFNQPVMVGETKLPAGDCDIRVLRGASDTTILVLRSENGRSVAALASHMSEEDSTSKDNASIVLSRHGDDLQLSKVLFSDHTGYQLSNVE